MDRTDRLKRYLLELALAEGGIEAIGPAAGRPVPALDVEALERAGVGAERSAAAPEASVAATIAAANAGLDKVKRHGLEAVLTPEETAGIEAIILPRERPAADIVDGRFRLDHDLWRDLNADGNAQIHSNLINAIGAVGRIELPGQTRIPFGGTGFVVGDGLIMTNRHVAEIFAHGSPLRPSFRPGWRAEIDFLRERGRSERRTLAVRRVAMIHPYWDMALLEVEGLAADTPRLTLATADIGELSGARVAVIGYPAYDPERNDIGEQNRIFGGVFGVKRLQPGRLGERRDTPSYRKLVPAGTHDCSTLGGNSGSCVVDLESGKVLAVHFAGRYLETNYCVPAGDLARDGRVVDAGVKFDGRAVSGPPPWQSFWTQLEQVSDLPLPGDVPADGPQSAAAAPSGGNVPHDAGMTVTGTVAPDTATTVNTGTGAVTFTVPLTITISLGTPVPLPRPDKLVSGKVDSTEQPRLVKVWHDPDYTGRPGYDEAFLGPVVPMPEAADPSVLAPLLAGGTRLDYRNFSIRMHAQRRLALVVASNVTDDPAVRRPEPGRRYDRDSLAGLGPKDIEMWFPDPRLAAEHQLPDIFYSEDRGAFDKGHLVRRDDVAWGETFAKLRQANGDTYHVTNCSPQIAQFNQSQRGRDNWGDLENLVLAQAGSQRLSLFAGPILDPGDPVFIGVGEGRVPLTMRIPRAFWKVVVARTGVTEIAAFAFVLDQDLTSLPLEFTVGENFRQRMVSIAELERRTGVVFAPVVRAADRFDDDAGRELAFRAGIERAVGLCEPPEQRSPNPGDDEAAAAEAGVPPLTDLDTEAPDDWRLAEALKALRAQVNLAAPRRSKVSDGSIGDARHRTRASDHNPWVRDGGMGVVTAIDITHDPAGGCDADLLAEGLRAGQDRRIKYIIWNRRIANRQPRGGAPAWGWRPYSGSNPHDKHIHISVRPEKEYYDDREPWTV